MSQEAAGQQPAKGRKRSGGKAAERPAASKVKCTIHLTVEASQRLDIHATMMGLDRSSLVERLVTENLRRWVVSDRGVPSASGGEAAA
jgi:hypothetical protein